MGSRARRIPIASRVKDTLGCYAFLMPNIVGFLAFTLGPVIAAVLLSFCRWDLISGTSGITWVGLSNYRELLHDPEFWHFMSNTMFFMLAVPLSMVGSLLLAIALNQKLTGVTVFRTVFFLPSMCVPVAVYLLWQWIFNGDCGMINRFLAVFGIAGPKWLLTPMLAKCSVMIAGLWMSIGGANMILYLAGLQGVPRDLYEAAEIDGANPVQKFFSVTWPMLTPTTFFVFIMSIIGGLQGNFEGPYMMTKGGPAGATTTIMYYIYNNAFAFFKMGYASAIACVLFAIILIATLINWRFIEGRIGYY